MIESTIDRDYISKEFNLYEFNVKCNNIDRLLLELADTLNDMATFVDMVDNDPSMSYKFITRASMLNQIRKDIDQSRIDIQNIEKNHRTR